MSRSDIMTHCIMVFFCARSVSSRRSISAALYFVLLNDQFLLHVRYLFSPMNISKTVPSACRLHAHTRTDAGRDESPNSENCPFNLLDRAS